jgi:2-polyprenyl-6-methoxyphenol hydroxylase-like FAD-dependent oxidoreductase
VKVLINGAGIAGMTLAWALVREGHDVMVTENSPGPRDDGYMIDFFGPGWEAAKNMDLLPDLERIHYPIEHLTFINSKGDEKFSLPYSRLRKAVFDDRHFNFLRGDFEKVLFEKIRGKASIRFGMSVESMQQYPGRVEVVLSDKSVLDDLDLLVGADGIHSRIRQLAFGDDSAFITYLGYHAVAFTTEDRDLVRQIGDRLYTLTVPGKQINVYPVPGERIATLFLCKHDGPPTDFSPERALAELDTKYAGMNWIIPRLVEICSRHPDVYFDSVSQVVMPIWRKGRVVIIGDAGHCVSLIAGQGASLAVAGAYILQRELAQAANIPSGLAKYEQKFRPVIEGKQRSGRNLARWFIPNSSFRLRVRDLLLETATRPTIAGIIRHGIG